LLLEESDIWFEASCPSMEQAASQISPGDGIPQMQI